MLFCEPFIESLFAIKPISDAVTVVTIRYFQEQFWLSKQQYITIMSQPHQTEKRSETTSQLYLFLIMSLYRCHPHN